MEIGIINEMENPLFNRKEIQLSLKAEITPSREEVAKIISEKFLIPGENIKIKKISGKFGSKIFTITANIYASEEDKNKIEPKKKKESERKVQEQSEIIVKESKTQEGESLINSNIEEQSEEQENKE